MWRKTVGEIMAVVLGVMLTFGVAGSAPFQAPDSGGSDGSGNQVGAVVAAVAAIGGIFALFVTGHPILGGILLALLVAAGVWYFIKRKGW